MDRRFLTVAFRQENKMPSLPYRYRAHGLRIAAALAIPEWHADLNPTTSDAADCDATIRIGVVERQPAADAEDGRCYYKAAAEVCILWRGVGILSVQHGRAMVVQPAQEADERSIRLFILGRGMSILLQQRGLIVLHGSAVAVGDGAVIFVGDCGAGKSTTAAALCLRGHRLLTDDISAIDVTSDPARPTLWSGALDLRLCPDAAVAIGERPAEMPLVRAGEDKVLHRMVDDTAGAATPGHYQLRRVYVLEDGPALRIEPLRPSAAVVALLRNSFAYRILQHTEMAEGYFARCLPIAPLVRRLARPRNLAALPQLAAFVEGDVGWDRGTATNVANAGGVNQSEAIRA
jgi:hypothetical protein